MVMKKKWFLKAPATCNNQKQNHNYDLLIKSILHKRGLETSAARKFFLNPQLKDLYDPFLLSGMEKAVSRIMTAVSREEKIIVYGDYDVDGVTSSALLTLFMARVFDYQIDYYIPDRIEEGYGLNKKAIQKIIADGYGLLITVDCGISALQEINLAAREGLDIIVTDHHQPGTDKPEALAIINPHQEDDDYPCKYLAGVGVTFKLCQALLTESNFQEEQEILHEFLDLVALGSVADIVPLKDENRILVKKGLEKMSATDNTGLKALLNKLGLDGQINSGHLGFVVAPPVNAAGRLEDAGLGFELLTTDDRETAEKLAARLDKLNQKRQLEEEETLQQAMELIERDVDFSKEKGIVLASSQWHPGVIGIVASRIVEKYYRPTILIALDDKIGKGSCRSIHKLNMYEALEELSGNLLGFGGHTMAAGLTIAPDRVDVFRKHFNNYLEQVLEKEDLIPGLKLEALLEEDSIDLELNDKINQLRPFGMGNPAPRFLLNYTIPVKAYSVGKEDKHMKIELENGVEGIAFNHGGLTDKIEAQETVLDLAFKISQNEWQGNKTAQLQVEDINFREDPQYYPVYFQGENFFLADKRGVQEIAFYIKQLVSTSAGIAVYVNSGIQKRKLKSFFAEHTDIGCVDNLKTFEKNEKGILLFSENDFDERVSGPKINELLFVSLPFSLQNMLEIVDSFDYVPEKSIIHLAFGREEYFINQKIIKNKIPTSTYLKKFFDFANDFSGRKISIVQLEKKVKENSLFKNKKHLQACLDIGFELGLVVREENFVLMKKNDNDLDLSSSIRYNKMNGIITRFNRFCNLAYDKNLFSLLNKIEKYRRG